MFLWLPLKSSLSLRISKIHLLERLFLLWTKCFHYTQKNHILPEPWAYVSSKSSVIYHLFKGNTKSHQHLTWCQLPLKFVTQHSEVALPANILKPCFDGLDSFFVPTKMTLFLSLCLNCKLETYRNANFRKKGFTKLPCKAIHSRHSPTA